MSDDESATHAPAGYTIKPRKRFSAVELLVCVGITALLIAIVLPSLRRMRDSAGRVPCASNLRQIGQALFMYVQDHGGTFPDKLERIVGPNYVTTKVFVCPATGDTPSRGTTPEQIKADLSAGGHLSYVYVGAGLGYDMGPEYVVAYDRPENHAPEGSYVVFADGHVDWVAAPAMRYVLDEVAAGRLPVRLRPGGPATAPAPAPAIGPHE